MFFLFCQDRSGYRALMQQARENGRLQQIEELKKQDAKGFSLMVMEFRQQCLAEKNGIPHAHIA